MNTGGENLAKTLLYEPLVKAGIEALKTQFPFLRFPLLSQFIDWIILKYADLFFDKSMTEANMVAIALETNAEKIAYRDARDALLKAVTPEEKLIAKKDFHDKLAKLIDQRPNT